MCKWYSILNQTFHNSANLGSDQFSLVVDWYHFDRTSKNEVSSIQIVSAILISKSDCSSLQFWFWLHWFQAQSWPTVNSKILKFKSRKKKQFWKTKMKTYVNSNLFGQPHPMLLWRCFVNSKNSNVLDQIWNINKMFGV